MGFIEANIKTIKIMKETAKEARKHKKYDFKESFIW